PFTKSDHLRHRSIPLLHASRWTGPGKWESNGCALPMGNRPLTERIKEYQQLVAEVARLQAEVDRDRPAALAALPAAYGYPDMGSFIKAVLHACRQPRRRKPTRVPQAQTASQPSSAEIGAGMAKATQPASTPVEPSRPSGTSLDDPRNFG